ncbi:MAG: glycosyltransferase family 4 protein [Candidatus Heimdallarchaeota archaeon]
MLSIYNNSTKFFVVSNFGKKRFYKLLSEPNKEEFDAKVKVIPMGIYASKIKNRQTINSFNENKFNIMIIGRIVKKKGIKYAIKAMKKLDNIDFALHICGDGPLKEELENLTSELDLNENVKFYGWITENDKYSFLHSADILLVPSVETLEGNKEGLPVVILESLAAELPIIASDVGGIKDAVINGETGFLIKEKSVDDIVKKIKYIYENKDVLKILEQNIKSHAHKFDWKEIARLYLDEIKTK